MGEKNFQNPLLNFLVFLGFTSLRVFDAKLRFHYSTTDVDSESFFPPLKKNFVFVKCSNISGPPRSLRSECFRNVKKSQIGACSGVPPSQHADGQY